jgi:hypothetical protein
METAEARACQTCGTVLDSDPVFTAAENLTRQVIEDEESA